MVLLSTTEQPEGLITRGKSCLVQARYVTITPSIIVICTCLLCRVCHSKKRYSGEQNAINVSKVTIDTAPVILYTFVTIGLTIFGVCFTS